VAPIAAELLMAPIAVELLVAPTAVLVAPISAVLNTLVVMMHWMYSLVAPIAASLRESVVAMMQAVVGHLVARAMTVCTSAEYKA